MEDFDLIAKQFNPDDKITPCITDWNPQNGFFRRCSSESMRVFEARKW
jgi:hypothetical protein